MPWKPMGMPMLMPIGIPTENPTRVWWESYGNSMGIPVATPWIPARKPNGDNIGNPMRIAMGSQECL